MPLLRCVESITSLSIKPVVLMLVFVLLSSPASAAQSCQSVDQELTTARKEAYGRLVEASITKPLKPGSAVVTRFMKSGQWSIAWSEPADLEEGVFFYHQEGSKTRFVDVWGGYAVPSEKPKLTRWARSLGANFPDGLARCFADAVTHGH